MNYNSSEWQAGVSVPVKASLDGLVDGDVTRMMELGVRLEYNLTVEVTQSVGTQEVRLIYQFSV